MNRTGNDGRDAFWADEARVRRFVRVLTFTRCVLGPVVLFGLLFATAYWEPAGSVPSAEYLPAQYSTAAAGVEERIQAF